MVTVGQPANAPPTANLTWSCSGLECSFRDASSDADGNVTTWEWDFGDGGRADVEDPSHAYGAEGTYTVELTVTDDDGATASASKQVTVSVPGENTSPVANFTSSCSGLACAFTDQSTDTDGNVTLWSWSFGDGATSTAPNPSRTYAAGGTYTVTLVVTDDEGATHQRSASVTVTATTPSISLTASGYTNDTKHLLRYNWSGAVGEKVDLYRNDVRAVTTANDGHQLTGFEFKGTATYRVKVCQAKTTVCSAERTVTLSN